MSTVDPEEIAKFESMAREWWDPEGKFKPLHQINPIRVAYIQTRMAIAPEVDLTGVKILDIGCGGGLLAEALAELNAQVTGIDRSDTTIGVAKARQTESGSTVTYRNVAVETLAQETPGAYDAVLAMEVLEHVPDPEAFLAACCQLLRPGGTLFFATINRTPKAWLLAIAGAEYLLRWLPRGTHQYAKLLRPSEIEGWLRQAGVRTRDLAGVTFDPLHRTWAKSQDVSVNYMGYGVRDD